MSNITKDQNTNYWAFTAVAAGGVALPQTIATYDVIPKRIRWEPSATTAAGDTVIIQDVQGKVVYKEVANGAYFEPSEQRPREHEKWIGFYNTALAAPPNTGITITQLDSGVVYIAI